MKNLKKAILLIVICLFSVATYAQFTVGGGLTLANMFIEDYDEEGVDKVLNPGFTLGFTYNIPLSGAFSFEPGLLFGNKGVRLKAEDGDDKAVVSWVNNYIDIPVTFRFTKEINGGISIYGSAGPYLAYGLSGKIKYKYTYDGNTETEEDDVSFGNDQDENDLKPLDYGLNMGAGVLFGVVKVGLNFDYGFANISLYEDDKAANRVLRFTVAYVFGGN